MEVEEEEEEEGVIMERLECTREAIAMVGVATGVGEVGTGGIQVLHMVSCVQRERDWGEGGSN